MTSRSGFSTTWIFGVSGRVETISITGPNSPGVTRHERSSAAGSFDFCAAADAQANTARRTIRKARVQNKAIPEVRETGTRVALLLPIKKRLLRLVWQLRFG